MSCENKAPNGVKQYRLLLKDTSGWWKVAETIWADSPREAIEDYLDRLGINPPNEIAVQSTARTTQGIFKIYRVKPHRSYDLEAV